jgi:hypothetical protein
MIKHSKYETEKMAMKFISTTLVFCVSFCAFSQQKVEGLKNKYLKNYQGSIPAYSIISDTTVVQIDETPINIHLTKTTVEITIGKLQKTGTYKVLFKGKNFYVLDAFFEGELIPERIIVNERNKTIVREGTSPQPKCTLKAI